MSKQSDLVNITQGDTLYVDHTSGKVGIGTSSPANGKLVVENNGSNLYLKQTTGDYGHIIGQNDSDGALTFSRRDGGNTERMRIQSNGTVLINTTSFFQGTKVGIEAPDIDIFSVRGNNVGAGYRYDSTSSTGLAAYFSHSSNTVAAGSITIGSGSTSYNTSSDYRLKENVVDLINASDRLKQLAPKRFNFIYADGEDQNPTVDGFLAHEVQAIVPEAVTGSKDAMRTQDVYDEDGNITGTEQVPDYQGIDQSKLVPLLTAALQEALNKITDLETRITALETV